MFRSTAALMALVALAGASDAQTPAPADGGRVRVTTADRQLIGIVRSVGEGTVALIDSEGDSVLVAMQDVRRLEMSGGWKSNGLRGAEIGAGAGFFLGLLLGSLPQREEPEPETILGDAFRSFESLERMGTYGLLGAVAGAAAGFAIGSRSESERWAPFELRRQVAYAAPGRIGVRVPF